MCTYYVGVMLLYGDVVGAIMLASDFTCRLHCGEVLDEHTCYDICYCA